MATFTEQLQKIVSDYRAAGQPWPATAEQMAEWAVANDRYQLARGIAVSQCKEQIARAMRLEQLTDGKGRSVRRYYAARLRLDGKQMTLWADWNAERSFMEVVVANRRNQILGECRQLKTDVDSYNDRRSADNPIQVAVAISTMRLAIRAEPRALRSIGHGGMRHTPPAAFTGRSR
jgi:hypothetical protein